MISIDSKQFLTNFASKKQTPFFCYFTRTISKNINTLKNTLPQNFDILYSLKANSNPLVVNFISKQKLSCDVSSINEMQIALNAGVSPEKISFTGPGKSEDDIKTILENQIGFIVVESKEELDLVIDLNYPKTKILLRIAWPDSNSQFGIDIDEIKTILKEEKLSSHIFGIHTFWKSQILNPNILFSHFVKSVNIAIELKNKFGLNLQYLNFGSGIGIPYYKEDLPLDLKKFSLTLKKFFESPEMCAELKGVHMFCESGRFIVGDAGLYITRVQYKKILRNKNIAILDGGFHHFMAAAGFGQVLKRPFPIEMLNSGETEIVTLAGKTCSELDIFASDIELPKLQVGDYVCIANAGAYGVNYSPVYFLHHSLPGEFLIEQ